MNKYELTVIFDTKKVEEGKKAFTEILTKREVKILEEEEWGVKRLAYPIEEMNEGFYLFLNVEADPLVVKQVDRDFRLSGLVLRHMFIVSKKSA